MLNLFLVFFINTLVASPSNQISRNSIASKKLFNQQKEYQYMAVCTDGHGVLTSWLDTQEAANKIGKEHEVTTKGHRWKIDTREKPQQKKDSLTTKTVLL